MKKKLYLGFEEVLKSSKGINVIDKKIIMPQASNSLSGNTVFQNTVYVYNESCNLFLPMRINCNSLLTPAKSVIYLSKSLPFNCLLLLPEDEQRKRLGSAKYNAWKSGDYRLQAYETPNARQRLSIVELKVRDKLRLKETIANYNYHNLMEIVTPITEEQTNAVKLYTCGVNGLYKAINKYLMNGKNGHPNELFDKIIANINGAINASILKDDLVVFRGMKSEYLFNLLLANRKTIDINSFQSTSLSEDVSSELYAGHIPGVSILMKIIIPKGTNCLDVSRVSTAPNAEDEILLPPTGQFLVKSVHYNETMKRLEVEATYDQ